MPSRRLRVATILVAAIVGLLICAVAFSELPELLTLTDNVANDFTVCKTRASHTAARPSAADYDSFRPDTKYLKTGEQVAWTSILEGLKPTSASLLVLLRTLRT